MTSFLVCAATFDELETFGLEGAETLEPGRLWKVPGGGEILAAVTGVGVPVTLLRLLPLLDRHAPSLLIDTGIAGAYSGSDLAIGDVVAGESEVFADLGMELPEAPGFRPLGEFPFADESLRAPLPLVVPGWASGIRRARGATVNAVTGSDATGALRRALFAPGAADFEGMEGAAFALAGRERGVPVAEVRAISNVAARRDMRPENVRLAIESLRAFWSKARESLPEASEVAR
jgi:futalosine hydrolase